MVELIFGLIGIISYIYLGIRIIPMRIKFAAFLYLLFLFIFLVALVIMNPYFLILWSAFTLFIGIIVFILVR